MSEIQGAEVSVCAVYLQHAVIHLLTCSSAHMLLYPWCMELVIPTLNHRISCLITRGQLIQLNSWDTDFSLKNSEHVKHHRLSDRPAPC